MNSIKIMLARGCLVSYYVSFFCTVKQRINIIFFLAMGCGILTTYTEVSNLAGLHGLLVYTIIGSIPILGFSLLGPLIRRKCPNGFVLTNWTEHRFGYPAALFLSFWTCVNMFLFMVSELSAVRIAIETLTGVNALAAIIVECVITSAYTSLGGFQVSFITDNFQGGLVVLLVIICAAGMGSYIDIDTSKVGPSGLLKLNFLGWQLIYILFVALLTNDCLLAGFWLRTFSSRTNKDLFIGCSIASFVTFAICTLVGTTGFLAVWSGDLKVGDDNGSNAFFILLAKMPRWLLAFVIIFVVCLSTCTFDSLQSAFVSTLASDLFRNKLRLIWIRGLVVLIIIPIIVLAIKVADDVLQIYFICDMISSCIVPPLFLGLIDSCFWWIAGWDIIIGSLSGMLGVFVYGSIYYHSAKEGGKLMLLWNGLYTEDWGPFGAFVTAPVVSVLVTFIVAFIRILGIFTYSKVSGKPFTLLEKPEIATDAGFSEQGSISSFPHVIDRNDSTKKLQIEQEADTV